MEKKELRRKHKRYPVRWKAAVVFDKSDGKPILHTQTQDLSSGGTAIHSDYSDLTGSVVTLLLAHPPRQPGEVPKMLKIRAQVVSTFQTPTTTGYRHGLSFMASSDEGLQVLADFLRAAESGASDGEEAAAVPSAAAPAAPAAPAAAASPAMPAAEAPAGKTLDTGASGRMATLRALAQAKLTEVPKENPQEEINKRIGEALQRAFQYLKELTEQLNVVKPAYTHKGYAIAGVPEFSGLAWESGRVDFRAKELGPSKKQWEQVAMYFRVSGGKQLRVARDYPASDRLKQLLTDNKIEFTAQEKRNERGSLASMAFLFPCEVAASVVIEAKFDTGSLLLRMRNVEHFGMAEHLVVPEAVTEAALEEFSGFILGETNRVGALLARKA